LERELKTFEMPEISLIWNIWRYNKHATRCNDSSNKNHKS